MIMVGLAVSLLAFTWLEGAYAQNQKKKQQETYTRPKPTEPIKPTIPSANRYQDDKVFLENADSLYRPANEFEEFQIVKGSVKFRQGDIWMFCDSAYYYPEKNSMDAYGHVEMRQGDTLFVYADKLYYDGFEKHATLVRGPSRNKVELKNRRVSLTTDSLDYNVVTETGWYTTGGRLDDGVNTLTSIYGEYNLGSKDAKFRDNVLLVNNKDGYTLRTEELDYNTATHIANINTRTVIEGANDTIITDQGWYDTRTDHAQLTSRSKISHRDSAMNVIWLEGDSIIYDKITGLSQAYMFRNPYKPQKPMVITDTARKVQLIGGYGEYNNRTRKALATEYPLLIEYSRPDSLFLRADTVLSFIRVENVWPDSLSHNRDAATRARLAGIRSPLDLAKGTEPTLTLYPAKDASLPKLRGFKSTSSSSARPMGRRPEREGMPPVPVIPGDSTLTADGLEPVAGHGDTLKRHVRRLDALGRDSAFMVPKDFHVAKAIGRARFFNQDIQGVADTMIYQQYDSLLHLIRKPVVWSGERQVMGNKINVHLNDSTVDWAYLPESGIAAEHVAEDFYNQISGSTMKAWISNKKIDGVAVDGNVQVIILPQEKDSTYNKLVSAESSHLTVDFTDGQMEHLKMWPEVTGTVSPLGEVRKSQQFLQGFRWLDIIRPKRQWYGDRVKWLDELGDVPEELDQWFREASAIRKTPVNPEEYKEQMRRH